MRAPARILRACGEVQPEGAFGLSVGRAVFSSPKKVNEGLYTRNRSLVNYEIVNSSSSARRFVNKRFSGRRRLAFIGALALFLKLIWRFFAALLSIGRSLFGSRVLNLGIYLAAYEDGRTRQIKPEH